MDFHEKNVPLLPHQLILQDRSNIEMSGVTDVETFDENVVQCTTPLGNLMIRGQDLHVHRLDMEGSSLSITGKIDALSYSDVKKGGLFGRLFR